MIILNTGAGAPGMFLMLILLAGLTFTVLIDPYLQRHQRNTMLLVIALLLSLVVRDYTGFQMDHNNVRPLTRTLVAVYGYCVRPVILILLGRIVSRKWKTGPAWVLAGVNAVIHLTALFSGVCFSIDEMNEFHRGPLGYSCHIISGLLLVYLVYLTIREYGGLKKPEFWIPVFNAVSILISVILDSVVDYRNYPVSFLTITVVGSNVFYYIWLHLQFVREHEKGLQAEQRIQIMMSQIQPHFLYNTLTTIQALCRIDPEKAFDTTGKFGQYLRRNLDFLVQPGLIPIRKELEYTKIYADIEKVRFPNIQVSCDVEDEDFSVPALTIQPMVENAIRHGVRIRPQGRVTVTVRKSSNGHEIVIRDNGKGFDVKQAEASDQTHIGIRNVRERIEKMCGGTLVIQSSIDEGTVVMIQIPDHFEGFTVVR